MKRLLVLVILSWFLVIWGPYATSAQETDFDTQPATPELIQELQDGGFVLYMRHGPTDQSQADQYPGLDLDDCSTQRQLTQEGREVAARVGEAIRKADIPLGEIISSPMCRCKNTAEAAFHTDFSTDEHLMYTAHLTEEEKEPKSRALREFLSQPVPKGQNRILVGHGPNMMDLMEYFVSPEGAVVVFQPEGDQEFEYLATIAPGDWENLLP